MIIDVIEIAGVKLHYELRGEGKIGIQIVQEDSCRCFMYYFRHLENNSNSFLFKFNKRKVVFYGWQKEKE